jgi:hypothetical protein
MNHQLLRSPKLLDKLMHNKRLHEPSLGGLELWPLPPYIAAPTPSIKYYWSLMQNVLQNTISPKSWLKTCDPSLCTAFPEIQEHFQNTRNFQILTSVKFILRVFRAPSGQSEDIKTDKLWLVFKLNKEISTADYGRTSSTTVDHRGPQSTAVDHSSPAL